MLNKKEGNVPKKVKLSQKYGSMVRVTSATVRALKQRCAANGETMGGVVEMLILKYLGSKRSANESA
jgi:hypothetical protein